MYYTLLVSMSVLLANAPASPPPSAAHGRQVQRPAPGPVAVDASAVDASKVAAARKQLKKVLQVKARTLDAAARHLVMTEAVKQAPTDEGLCSLVYSARSLHEELGAQLSETRDQLYELPSPAPGAPDPLGEFSQRVDRADVMLAGIGLVVGAETFYHSVRYGELATLAQQRSAAQRLLEAVSSIWREPNDWPVYIEQVSDVTGCWRPGALLEPLRRAFAVWREAPQCLHQALTPALQRAMLDAVRATCFCEDRALTLKQLKQLEAEYQKAPLPGAREAVAGVRKALRSTELEFNCQ